MPFEPIAATVRRGDAQPVRVLAQTHQVRLFTETGQLGREVAWSRYLADLSD